ncbi:TolC family protein [Nitrospira sp. Kam-Ns4a]
MKPRAIIRLVRLLIGLGLLWIGATLTPARAAEPEAPELRLSLHDAIQAALDNNPTVRLFREKIQAARGVAQNRLGALLPNLSGNYSATRRTFFLGTFGITGGVVGPFDVFDTRGALTQNLFSLSLIQRWQAARAGIEVAELEAEVNKRDTMATVGLLYVEALRAEAAVKASEANLELNQQLLKLAQDRKVAGLATGLDVTRAQVQLENERQRLLAAQNQRERAKLNLIRAIGIDFDVRLVLTDELKLVEVPEEPWQQVLTAARANRVELKAQARRERLAALSLSSITSERIPSLAINGDYGFIGVDPDRNFGTYTGALVLSVPVFDGGQREGRIAEGRSQVLQEQIRTKDLNDQITLEVRDALLTIESTRKQVLVSQEGLRLALKELELSRERFAVGVASNIEVTNAQTSVARARDNLIEALSNFNAARINLARARGQLEQLY